MGFEANNKVHPMQQDVSQIEKMESAINLSINSDGQDNKMNSYIKFS